MNIETQYLQLLQDILDNGTKKSDRTGTGTLSVFGRELRHNFKDGFPLLTTKQMYFKGIVTELLWFLRGDTHLKYLHDNNCHIWDGDAYRAYLDYCSRLEEPDFDILFEDVQQNKVRVFTKAEFISQIKSDENFSVRWGDLGKIYGYQWRKWEKVSSIGGIKLVQYIDQITELIHTLKTNPDSRRMFVSAWNPSDSDEQVLPPCHTNFQVYTRELTSNERRKLAAEYAHKNGHWQLNYVIFPIPFTSGYVLDEKTKQIIDDETNRIIDKTGWHIPKRAISLKYNARSQDVPLGTPFNIASYALLLQILGKMTNMIPDELIGSLGDCHIYLNQIEGVKEQLKRQPLKFPEVSFEPHINSNGTIDDFLDSCNPEDFKLTEYKHQRKIKFPLSN